MIAGDRLFVDLLPESWTGEPPGLPREVVEELAQRANEAERLARQKLALAEQRKIPAVRVRVAGQPTFTRYIFELPELTGVTAERGKDRLKLTFAKPLRFDLSDAKLRGGQGGGRGRCRRQRRRRSRCNSSFRRQADIRTFREDSNYVVDVSPIDAQAGAPPLSLDRWPAIAGARHRYRRRARAGRQAAAIRARRRRRPPRRCPRSPPTSRSRRPPSSEPRAAPARAGRASRSAIPNRPVIAELRRQGDNLRLFFPFAAPTPAAVFQRADTLWLVFDTKAAHRRRRARATIRARPSAAPRWRARTMPRWCASSSNGRASISVEPQDSGWLVTVGEAMAGATKPLIVARNIVSPGRTSITIPFDEPQKAHWLSDADIGDRAPGHHRARARRAACSRARTSSICARWPAPRASPCSRSPTISRPSLPPTR